jgi:hypothetical protein
MNDKAKVYNLIVLDKSGSMCSIADAAIAGFNETVGGIRSAQKRYASTQEHFVSLLPFCACSMDYVYNCVPVDEVKNLTSRDYEPCCSTPLYDAMGKGINDLLKRTKDEGNATVIVTIITDGMENASKEYNGAAIKALVDKMRDERGWNFAYIGTNQDVHSVAMSLSITNTMFFEDTEAGMDVAWKRERKSRQRLYDRMDTAFCCAAPSASAEERVGAMREVLKTNKNYREMDEFKHRMTPDYIDRLKKGQIFVFGSNAAGHHGGGAAYVAMQKFGAIYGQGDGLQGQSYAISTMEGLDAMEENVRRFITFAKVHPELTFLVTRIGCGIAGYSVQEVAPLFTGAIDVENVWLPKEFWEELV